MILKYKFYIIKKSISTMTLPAKLIQSSKQVRKVQN